MPVQDKDTKATDAAVSRRNILLAGTTFAAARRWRRRRLFKRHRRSSSSDPQPRRRGETEHPRHLRRRHRHRQHQRLQRRPDGLRDAEHRPHRQGGHHASCTTTASSRCTAGRSAFLTGQHGIRTGLTKVGFPGAPMGMSQLDPSIGGLLKNLGYATGQFGKNHVGDRNESLPTVNGFDEFFGNLYHLNAEEEPELPDYPKDPAYLRQVRPARRAQVQGDRRATIRRSIRASARSASRRSRTPARSPRSAWRRSTTRPRPRPSTS